MRSADHSATDDAKHTELLRISSDKAEDDPRRSQNNILRLLRIRPLLSLFVPVSFHPSRRKRRAALSFVNEATTP